MADHPVPDRPLAPQAGTSPERATNGRFLIFHVAGQLYALPGDEVSEIIRIPPVARVPHSPKSLLGLTNLRGTVLPMIDTRSLLGRGMFATSGAARAIVTTGAAPVALAVDAVDALVALPADKVETRQAELAAAPGERLRGAFHAPGQRDAARYGTGRPGEQDREYGGDQPQLPPEHLEARTGERSDTGLQSVAKILDLPAMLAAAFAGRIRPSRSSCTAPVTAGHASAAVEDEHLLLSFDVAGQDYALPLRAVREIVPLPRAMTVVPRAEAVLLGVIAYRDSLLPLLSLRGLLGFIPVADFNGREKVIVTPVGGVLVGLVADGMRAIIRASASQIDAVPAMLAARSGGEAQINAIFRGDGGRRLVSVLAAEQLFREDVMRRLGDSSGAIAPRPDSTERSRDDISFVVFRLGEEEFALPVSAVDEVARVPMTLTRVPKTPDFLEGVMNLRGEVLPVVDQRRRFDLPKFEGAGRRLIVVRTERHRAGLIVDSVSEVLRCPLDEIRPAPDLAQDGSGDDGEEARLISGVINGRRTEASTYGAESDSRMIMVFDPAELLTRAERGVLDKLDLRAAVPDSPAAHAPYRL